MLQRRNRRDPRTRIFSRLKSPQGTLLNQIDGKIEFNQNVNIAVTPNESDVSMQPTDIRTDRAIAFFTEREIRKLI
jgi:hypothetical protein